MGFNGAFSTGTNRGMGMPKVYLTKESKDLDAIYDYIHLQMKHQKIRQKHIAAELGLTPAAVSHMLKNQTMTLESFVIIMRMLGKDATECIR